MYNWISTKDSLPEDGVGVLITAQVNGEGERFVCLGYYENGCWYSEDIFVKGFVVWAWCKLPSVYEGY